MTGPEYHVSNLRSGLEPRGATGERGSARVSGLDRDILGQIYGAAWRNVGLIQLEPGALLGPRELTGSELLLYVVAGTGVAWFERGDEPLEEQTSLALLMGETVHVENTGEDPLEIFYAEMGVESGQS